MIKRKECFGNERQMSYRGIWIISTVSTRLSKQKNKVFKYMTVNWQQVSLFDSGEDVQSWKKLGLEILILVSQESRLL